MSANGPYFAAHLGSDAMCEKTSRMSAVPVLWCVETTRTREAGEPGGRGLLRTAVLVTESARSWCLLSRRSSAARLAMSRTLDGVLSAMASR